MYPHLKNPHKYTGSTKSITARSGWEINFITKFLDSRTDVIEWSSEDIIIPYIKPTDNRVHRYFPDFYMKVVDNNNNTREYILEIKPKKETTQPIIPKRKTKNYITAVTTWLVNSAKWKYAQQYCIDQKKMGRDLSFIILTEVDLKGII
jgi:hypothetical protein